MTQKKMNIQKAQQIKDSYLELKNYAAVGQKFQMTGERVRQILNQYFPDEIPAIRLIVRKTRLKSQADKTYQEVEQLLKNQVSKRQIAKVTGVSLNTIINISHRLNLFYDERIFEDLTGKQFNDWYVIQSLGYQQEDGTYQPTVGGDRKFYWLCRCLLCGTEKAVWRSNLLNGSSRRCIKCGYKTRVK